MIKKLEVLANIAVVITSVVLCTVIAKKHLFPASGRGNAAAPASPSSPFANVPPRRTIQPGTKVSLPGIDWGKSDRTLLLALSTTCHFCSESAPFYQKLQQQKPNNVRLVAVLPQPAEDSRNYLGKLGVSVNEVVQAQLASVNVSGTPTLILIDNNGIVKDSWVGKLSDSEAAKVINRIGEPIS